MNKGIERNSWCCWICGSSDLIFAKPGNLPPKLNAENFQITDSQYGQTASLYRCESCGFLMCPDMEEVLSFYEEMSDPGYEETREERSLQARQLLKVAARFHPSGRLLDVGAGSGVLVQVALDHGFRAEGVEPSRDLQARASELGLPVQLGVLPQAGITGPYEVVTLVDVIEHVSTPLELLKDIREVMAPKGVCLIVTPDVSSIAARLLGWRWWHFRIAHIGYFNRKTLTIACQHAGFNLVKFERPGWYFPASYLAARALTYAPGNIRPSIPKILDRVTIPLNLFDSLLAICVAA